MKLLPVFSPYLQIISSIKQTKQSFYQGSTTAAAAFLSSRKISQQAYQSMFPGANLRSLPSFTSLPSFSTNFLPTLPGSNEREVCHLDNSNTVLVYNIAEDRLFFYTQTELVSLSSYHPAPLPLLPG
jgi:hypothetical protein